MENKTKTSQQLEIERYNREAQKWAKRKERWNAWKQSQNQFRHLSAENEMHRLAQVTAEEM